MLDNDKFIISKEEYDSEKVKHLHYLSKKDFILKIHFNFFSGNNLNDIVEKGNWYSALQNGEIKPITLYQQKFINVLNGRQERVQWGELYDILLKTNKEEKSTLIEILKCKENNIKDIIWKLESFSTNLLGFFDGDDLSYFEILNKAKNKLNIQENFKTEKDIERAISLKVLKDALSKMTNEQKIKFEKEIINIANKEKGNNYTTGSMIAALTAANLSGFGVYLLATTTLSTLSGIIGITLPFAAYTALTSSLAFLTGPVGWLGAGLFTLWKFTDTNYDRLIPAIIYIHWLREKYTNTDI
jgi:uncharacterized protein YaaW (UPF0174 family)